ncbi:hypothetical protein [Streptomyces mayteni]
MSCAVPAVCALLLLPAADAAPTGSTVEKGEAFITADTGGVFDLEAGECFVDPAYSEVLGQDTVLYTPCDEGADNQVYGFVAAPDDMTAGAYDAERLAAFGWEICGRGFASYWPGEAAAGLDFYPVLPTERTWGFGDRDVMCVVHRPGAELTDSLLPLA